MGSNPYRKDAELSTRARLIGGLLFAAVLAAPFAVRSLIADPPDAVSVADGGADAATTTLAALAEPSGSDSPDPVATPPAPVSAPRHGAEPPAPLSSPADAADAAGQPDLPATPVVGSAPDALDPPRARRDTPASGDRRATAVRRIAVLPVDLRSSGGLVPAGLRHDGSLPEAAEHALDLSRGQRREIQLRLALLGHDPQIIDGVFGDLTRAAIREAQAGLSLPVTGFLDSQLLGHLERLTDTRLAEYRETRRHRAEARRRAVERRRLDAARVRVPDARNAPECRRDATGEIAQNQGISCDWALLEESLSALFRRGS